MKIKWTNKLSGETGYVKKLNRKGKFFENTYEAKEVKIFSKGTVAKALEELQDYCPDNTYEAIGGRL